MGWGKWVGALCYPETKIDLEKEYQDEETFNKLFDEIQLNLNAKIENTMCFVKNLNADAKAIKEEKAQLDKREKQKEALADRLQNRIDYYIKHQYMDKNGNVDNQVTDTRCT